MSEVELTVIIPARDAEATLPGCLAALERQTVPRESFEVIVVDDGSRDATGEIAQDRADQVLRQPGAGPAAARNRGLQVARGSILLFTDADCEPEPEWIEVLSGPIREGGADGTKGTYRTRQTELVARFVQFEYEEKYRRMARERQIDFVDTYSAGFHERVFQEIGPYDEGFPGASVEDQELSFRAARAGFRLVFVPEARVWHRHADSLMGYGRKKFKIAYWKVRVLRSHPDKVLRDSHTPQSLKLQMLLAPFLVAGTVLLPLRPGLWPVPAMLAMGFLLLSAPLLRRILPRDPAVALAAPALLLVRSLALAAGLAWGALRGVR